MAEERETSSPFAGENDLSWKLRMAWRSGVRPVWRSLRVPLVIVAGFSVIVLGTWGFREEGYDFWESLFRSFQLYGFAGGEFESDDFWALNFARVLGPLIVGVAAIRGLLVLSREQLRLIGFRMFRQGHIVIVGLGDVGFTLAAELNELGARVIAIDRDAAKPSIAGCKERGISALVGDATDSSLLRAACVHRAKHLIVAPGTDSVAIDVVAAATSITKGRTANPLQVIAHIEERALWQALRAHTLSHGHARARSSARTSSPPPPSQSWAPSVVIEFFNLYETASRQILDKHAPFTGAEARERSGPAVLIVADQAIAEVLVVNVARMWRSSRAHSRAKIEITLGGPGAEAETDRIRERYPAIDGISHLQPWEIDLGSPEFRESDLSREAAAAYVALADEAKAVATSLTIASTRWQPKPVVLIVNDERAGSLSIAGIGKDAGPVRLFGILNLVLNEEFLVGGLQETLAKEIHLYYYRKELAKGGEKLPYVKPWKKLDDDAKSSNRDSAADIPRKLDRLGCRVVPAALADPERSKAVYEEQLADRLEEFAKAEHERWIAERGRNGWKLGPKRDNDAKIHPSMKPYDDLTEPEMEKDRDVIRNLPEQLAMAGFAIEHKPVATAPGSAPAPPR